MKAQNDNWLLTFSDLFFILVAFFLLRHQMLETPKSASDRLMPGEFTSTPADTPSIKSLARLVDKSIFKRQNEHRSTTLRIPIHYSWFSNESELSSRGEEAIRGLKWKLKGTNAGISLDLYINQNQASLSSEQRLMLEKLTLRLNSLKKLSSINILTKKGDVNDIPGAIEINYN